MKAVDLAAILATFTDVRRLTKRLPRVRIERVVVVAIVLAAVMLVVGQQYLENESKHLPMSPASQMASVP